MNPFVRHIELLSLNLSPYLWLGGASGRRAIEFPQNDPSWLAQRAPVLAPNSAWVAQREPVLAPKDLVVDKELLMAQDHGLTLRLDKERYEEIFREESKVFPVKEGTFFEASKTIGDVLMGPEELKSMLMSTEKWKRLFSSIVADAEAIGTESVGRIDVKAHLQLLSLGAGVKKTAFARVSHQLDRDACEGGWMIIDVPLRPKDDDKSSRPELPFIRSCLIFPSEKQGYHSRVVFLEMGVYYEDQMDESFRLYGPAIWSDRWFWTLSRESLHLSNRAHGLISTDNSPPLRLLTLANEMTRRFYKGIYSVSPTSARPLPPYQTLAFSTDGVNRSAAMCVKLFVDTRKLVRLLRWTREAGDASSVLVRVDNTLDAPQMMLEELWIDKSGALLVSSPVSHAVLTNNVSPSSAIHSVFAISILPLALATSVLSVTSVEKVDSVPDASWKYHAEMKIVGVIAGVQEAVASLEKNTPTED